MQPRRIERLGRNPRGGADDRATQASARSALLSVRLGLKGIRVIGLRCFLLTLITYLLIYRSLSSST